MGCIITFDDNVSTGVFSSAPSTSGILNLVGYSTVAAGPFGAGGNFPWTTNSYGASVDSSNLIAGFYKFKYESTLPTSDPCYGFIEFVVAIIQGTTDVPLGPIEYTLCSGDSIRNIFDDSGLYDLSGVNPVLAVLTGDTISDGYSANTAGVNDDTFNPDNNDSYPQTVEFTITYTPTVPATYTALSCTNCTPKAVLVRYIVTEEFEGGTAALVAVCNDGDI